MTDAEFRGLANVHLTGSFGQNDLSILTPTCAEKINRVTGFSFGKEEKKLSKTNHNIFYSEVYSTEVFGAIGAVWQKAKSIHQGDETKIIECFGKFLGMYLRTAVKIHSANHDFIGFCFALHMPSHEMVAYQCACNQTGTVSFIATKDYRGVQNDF